MLYARLKKALYGTLQASMLFWKDLSGRLEGWNFTLNPYDQCVANKDIGGSQCTIIWHVDDLKISHRDPQVVQGIIDQLSEAYGKHSELTVNHGPVHDYLGMTVDYSQPGKVRIGMDQYVRDLIDDMPDDERSP